MNFNFKLYFKYILFNCDYLFLKYTIRNDKNINILLPQLYFYYLTLHLKMSSLFYSLQLCDNFSYELPLNANLKNTQTENNFVTSAPTNSLLVYNFHSIVMQQRFFIFLLNTNQQNINKNSVNYPFTNTISELFLNANWLEREIAELHGVFFSGKKDLRNLMLQYGDTSAPMQRSFPSIGTREIFYDTVTDLLIQQPVSIQF